MSLSTVLLGSTCRLRPLCGDCVLYLSSTSFMWGLRPLCCCYVLYVVATSFIYRLRPLSLAYVLYVGITSFMSELPVAYVLYVGITSFRTGLRPAYRKPLSSMSRMPCSMMATMAIEGKKRPSPSDGWKDGRQHKTK